MIRVSMYAAALALLVGQSTSAAEPSAWTLARSTDPFDDQPITSASLTAGELEIRVVCKGEGRWSRTFRIHFDAGQVMEADTQAFGTNTAANAGLGPMIDARVRFDDAKARTLQFFAADGWQGFWTGQGEAARLVRSFIGAERFVLGIFALAGPDQFMEVAVPADSQPLLDVMDACGQKVSGRSFL